MNKLACGIAGFALGIFTGGIIVNTIYKKIVNRILDEKEEIQAELDRKININNEAVKRLREAHDEFVEYKEKVNYEILAKQYYEEEEQFDDEDDAPVDEYGEVIEEESELEMYPIRRYNHEGEEMEEITVNSTKPYIIPPEEFEVYDDYESDSYTWYPDGWVTDSLGLPVDPNVVKDLLGVEFPLWFGKYAPDEVWIRNDERRMDFSVVRDAEDFEDIATPRQRKLAGI